MSLILTLIYADNIMNYKEMCMTDKNVTACGAVGADFMGKKKYQESRRYHKMACENREFRSCAELGTIYVKGLGVKKDIKKALELYKKGCDGGDALSCNNAGMVYTLNLKDNKKAFKYFNKAAQKYLALGLFNRGTSYFNGIGTQVNKEKAFEDFKMSCYEKNKNACTNLGIMFAYGNGIKRDLPRALQTFKLGCKYGDKKSCTYAKHIEKTIKKFTNK